VSGVHVRNLEKIHDKWLLFQRFVTSIVVTCFMKELPYVFLFASFFTAAYFHLGGHRHFSFSHCRYKNVLVFVAMKYCFVCFLPLSIIHVVVDIEI